MHVLGASEKEEKNVIETSEVSPSTYNMYVHYEKET